MKTSSTNKGNTMLIQLSQAELKDAVRLFVTSSLGIDLTDKTLTTTFTATRGDAGVITNLDIQKIGHVAEAEIPGYTAASPEVIAEANAPVAEAKEVKAPAPKKEKGEPAPVTTATLAPAKDLPVAQDTATNAAAEAKTEPEQAAADDVAQAESAAEAPAVEEAAKPQTTSLFG